MHAIDDVFAPVGDSTRLKEAMSVKKLLTGDASWATSKIILGWLIDTANQTIELPPHRAERLLAIFADLRGKRRVSVTRWRQILGELRSMVLAVPGGKGLFSCLQLGLRLSDRHRVRLSDRMRDQLADFEYLAASLSHRPTRLSEIVPDHPSALGACDASKRGMGGVWFLPNGECLVWRQAFPAAVQTCLVSSANMSGTITNSDLELAGILAHQDVLTHTADVRECTVAVLNDNTPAISRCQKGSITSDSAAAYLLRINSLHQRFHRYLSRYAHISGEANAMADDSSRMFHLPDNLFLSHFEQHYPQEKRWRLCHLPPGMLSALTSALLTTRVAPPSFLSVPTHRIGLGRYGKTFAWKSKSPHSSTASTTPSHSSRSLLNATGTAASPKALTASDLAPWSKCSATLARRWPGWGPRTPA